MNKIFKIEFRHKRKNDSILVEANSLQEAESQFDLAFVKAVRISGEIVTGTLRGELMEKSETKRIAEDGA